MKELIHTYDADSVLTVVDNTFMWPSVVVRMTVVVEHSGRAAVCGYIPPSSKQTALF